MDGELDKIKKILIYESNIAFKRVLLRFFREHNFKVESFDNPKDLFNYPLKTKISGLFISDDAFSSKEEAKQLIERFRKKFPKIVICVSSNKAENEFPCALNKTIQYGVIERKLTVEFYKQDFQQRKSKFNFVGVAIASSTGGPITLQHYFSNLKYTEKAAFFIVLHAPAWMLESYAKKLDSVSPLEIKLGINGTPIKPGVVYVAPGDFHMLIDGKERKIKLTKDEPYNFLRPAADPLFFSVAENFTTKSLGVVFTGMGYDGSLGSGKIHAAGGKVLVQSPDTAVIHSMPKSVIDLGIADRIEPLGKMAQATIEMIEELY